MSEDALARGRRWVSQAGDDLDTARLLRDHDRHAVACFLSQQVAEKALKGLLYGEGAEMVLGHSVAGLCSEVAELHPALAERCAEWAALDQHYIPTRYPDALPGGTPADVYRREQSDAAVATATDVLDRVTELLGSD